MPKSKTPGTLKETSRMPTASAPTKGREPTDRELENRRLKVEATRALGLWDKVEAEGWGALTAAESGRIGGFMTRVRFQAKRQAASPEEVPRG